MKIKLNNSDVDDALLAPSPRNCAANSVTYTTNTTTTNWTLCTRLTASEQLSRC